MWQAGVVAAVLAGTLLKLVVGSFLLALLETSIAKMRFYRMQEYLSTAALLGAGALILSLF
jgi:formate hydrogenlyase subunit 4